MRLLIWHVDAFKAEPTQRGRSKVADSDPRAVDAGESLVVFAAVEKADEDRADAAATAATQAITDMGRRLGARVVVLHSFAHLFVELSRPEVARDVLAAVQHQLEAEGYTVMQSAFGWFNRLEMRAKGHPLSRVARQV